jgi:hypothetical protein
MHVRVRVASDTKHGHLSITHLPLELSTGLLITFGIAVAYAATSLWYKCVSALTKKALKTCCKMSVRRHMSRKLLCRCKETRCSARPLLTAPVLNTRHGAWLIMLRKKYTTPVPKVAINRHSGCAQIVQWNEFAGRK